jgi:hypothetical protein
MIKRLMAAFAFAAVVSTPVSGAIMYAEDNTTPANVPGLTGFQTDGSMMDNMLVTACFSNAGCQQLSWGQLGGTSGGVANLDWSLTLAGDSFNTDWEFDFLAADLGLLQSLRLDARLALTIFDRTFGGVEGTLGSALGLDWDSLLGANTTINVTYLNPTSVGLAGAVGDLFQQVLVEFGDTGPRDDFAFVQDTDNDSRFGIVPEPSTLLLLGLGMLAFAGVHRRRA